MTAWVPVLAVIVVSWTMKAVGPLAMGPRRLPSPARSVIALLAPVLLAGLIVVELGGEDWSDVDMHRLVGVGVAGGVHLLKAPMLVAVLCGVLTTALLRLQAR